MAGPEDYFRWPNTEAAWGAGKFCTADWESEGLLASMGYHVGRTHGLSAFERELILGKVFSGPLPPLFSPEYMREWGTLRSPAGLKKMAESIASFARNAKRRRDEAQRDAVKDWQQDLTFLYAKYYRDHFGFAWPSTGV